MEELDKAVGDALILAINFFLRPTKFAL